VTVEAPLSPDGPILLAFVDLPAAHWDRLRTGNPMKRVFATVRHRTERIKGARPQRTTKLLVLKLVQTAAKT